MKSVWVDILKTVYKDKHIKDKNLGTLDAQTVWARISPKLKATFTSLVSSGESESVLPYKLSGLSSRIGRSLTPEQGGSGGLEDDEKEEKAAQPKPTRRPAPIPTPVSFGAGAFRGAKESARNVGKLLQNEISGSYASEAGTLLKPEQVRSELLRLSRQSSEYGFEGLIFPSEIAKIGFAIYREETGKTAEKAPYLNKTPFYNLITGKESRRDIQSLGETLKQIPKYDPKFKPYAMRVAGLAVRHYNYMLGAKT